MMMMGIFASIVMHEAAVIAVLPLFFSYVYFVGVNMSKFVCNCLVITAVVQSGGPPFEKNKLGIMAIISKGKTAKRKKHRR